jgi:purine-nucleoside/S-methyl-5'-thioadenosine phosphorylase / adenosine deaminase
MFSVLQAGTIEYLQASIFQDCNFLTHAFCTRRGGVSQDEYASLNVSFHEGDEDSSVLQNWGRLAAAFAIPLEQFLVVNQVHGDNIFVIKPYGGYFSSRAELDYDAIVTDRANIAICVKTADCVPVFIADRMKKIIAVVHGGWRGTALGLSAKVIRLFQDKYGSSAQDILAAIGPSIGKCCYQVDSTIANAFLKQKDREHFLFAGKGKNKWMLDLAQANWRQILDGGVPQENIEISDRCTKCNQDIFFSHRGAGGITGRQINFMMIKGDTPCRVLSVENHYSVQ